MKIQIQTLGCSKNKVDSEHILYQLKFAGMEISPEGEDLVSAGVDVMIINTCGFIHDAKEESINAILEAVEAKENGYISKVIVLGCLSQRYREELVESIPEVDAFLGAFDLDEVLRVFALKINSSLLTRRLITTPSHYAYLKISEGCDRICSYCAIPSIRGPHVSVPIGDLVTEAQYLASIGVKELIVIAQDTTYYGLDIYKKRSLAPLLYKLAEVPGIEWIRILYSYPAAFPEDVLEFMATSDKMCKYMDIPLQHSSTKVLHAMRRGIDGAKTRSLVETMRKKVPGVALRTTMIVGHPQEGKREFQNLLNFVEEYKFERLGAFTYSEEEGTWGANNLSDWLPRKVKQERYDELMELQAQISLNYNLSRIGTTEKVLVDSLTDGVLVGRSQKEAPEVDGEILIGSKDRSLVGQYVNVHIENANDYDLIGKII